MNLFLIKKICRNDMNGWYLHKKTHFPFTPYIHPLLISMHFTENDLITKRGYEFLDGYTKEHAI